MVANPSASRNEEVAGAFALDAVLRHALRAEIAAMLRGDPLPVREGATANQVVTEVRARATEAAASGGGAPAPPARLLPEGEA